MRKIEIETWAIRVLDSLRPNERVEDHFVELKREWLPAKQLARSLAGHANSAHGDNILWIVGADEKQGAVLGAPHEELANWWPQMEAEFADKVTPEMIPVRMSYKSEPVTAMLFKTDRAPYVVRNPSFGFVAGHSIEWEIPYRSGTKLRSATRNEMITLLSPHLNLPRCELRAAEVKLKEPALKDRWVQMCEIKAEFYLLPQDDRPIALDDDESSVSIEFPGIITPETLRPCFLLPYTLGNAVKSGKTLRTVGAICIVLNTSGYIPSIRDALPYEDLHFRVDLRPIGFEQKITMCATIPYNSLLRSQEYPDTWSLNSFAA